MSEQVPEPDDGMLDNQENDDQLVEDQNDDLNVVYLDSTNSNQDEFQATTEMEPTPAPPENKQKPVYFQSTALANIKKIEDQICVKTEAVDLETICTSFKGPVLHERLQFIIDHCPLLKRDAAIALVRSLKENTMNVQRYNQLMGFLEQWDRDSQCTRNQEMPKIDVQWIENTQTKATGLQDMLQAEYKKMKDEGVKESTRRAMEELFVQYVAVGNYFEALRLYGRGMREYCTQFKHIMKMWLEWLEVCVSAGEWSKVDALISQAQRSITDAEEAEDVAQNSSNRGQNRDDQAHVDPHSRANRALIGTCQAKIDALLAVCHMKSQRYAQALEKLVKTDVDLMGTEWLFSSSDIAVYTTVCALVALDRAELKKKVLTDSLCRKFLEAEPRLIELLTSFIRSDFGRCLDILTQRKDSFYLNPFLASHVDKVYKLIRQRAIIQYVRPFATARLDVMAGVFRATPEEMEEEVVALIECDKIHARIDALEGVVRAIDVDKRTDTIQNIDKLCDKLCDTANGIITKAIITQSRMYTGGERSNKRKEPTDEGLFEPFNRGRMPGMMRAFGLGGRGFSSMGGPGASGSSSVLDY